GDHRKRSIADRCVADLDNRLFGAKISRDQFVWFGDTQSLGDTRKILEMCRIERPLVPCDTDGDTALPWHRMAAKSKFFNNINDPINVGPGRVRFHYDKHRKPSPVRAAKPKL